MKLSMRCAIKAMVYAGLAMGFFAVSYAAGTGATAPPGSLGSVAQNVSSSLPAFSSLISAFSYVCGLTLTIIGFFQVRHHKEAGAAQQPLHKGLSLIVIGILMIALPSVIGMGASTLFKNAQTFGSQGGGCDQSGSISNCMQSGS